MDLELADFVREHAPDDAQEWLDGALSGESVGIWMRATPERPLSLAVVLPKTAVAPDVSRVSGSEAPDALRVLACLHRDASADDADGRHLRSAWQQYLRLANYIRRLPRAWLLATGDHEHLDFGPLAAMHDRPAGAPADPWSEVERDVAAVLLPLVGSLRSSGAPLAEVGVDLPAPDGTSSDAVGELVWGAARVAVVLPGALDAAHVKPDAAWQLFLPEDLASDPAPLLRALHV